MEWQSTNMIYEQEALKMHDGGGQGGDEKDDWH